MSDVLVLTARQEQVLAGKDERLKIKDQSGTNI